MVPQDQKIRVLYSTLGNKKSAIRELPENTLEEIYKYSQGIGINECVNSYLGHESGIQIGIPSLDQITDIDKGRFTAKSDGSWVEVEGWNSNTPKDWPGREVRETVRKSIEEYGLNKVIVISKIGSASNISDESTSILLVDREDIKEGYAVVYWRNREFGAREARKSRFDASSDYRVFKPHSITKGNVSEGRHAGIEILSIETDETDVRSSADVTYDYENIDYVATANDVPMRKDACILRAGGGEIRGHRGR